MQLFRNWIEIVFNDYCEKGFNKTICDNLSNYSSYEDKVQLQVTEFNIIGGYIDNLPQILVTLYLGKDLLRYGRNTSPNFILWNYNLGWQLKKDPRQSGFLNHDYLWSWNVHIKIFLMRGQTLFWACYKLVIELFKHANFWAN